MRDTIDMAREVGFTTSKAEWLFTETLKTFEALVRADERMVIAELCNEMALEAAKEQLPEASHALNVVAKKLREKAKAAKPKLKEKST